MFCFVTYERVLSKKERNVIMELNTKTTLMYNQFFNLLMYFYFKFTLEILINRYSCSLLKVNFLLLSFFIFHLFFNKYVSLL